MKNASNRQEVAPVSGKIDTHAVVFDIVGPLRQRGNRQGNQESLAEQLQRTTAALAAARSEVRALSTSLLVAQEEERRRIARDVHDDLSQRAALIEFKLTQVEPFVERPEGKEALTAAREDLAKLAVGIRNISHQLHPSVIADLGLPAALRQLVDEFNESGGSATFADRMTVPILDPLVRTALYRIAQEALRNVKKHAGRVPVRIKLSSSAQDLHLSIKDSGPGFAVNAKRSDRGLGLLSMRERARLIGATLMIRTRPGAGTQIAVRARTDGSVEMDASGNLV